MEMWRGRARVLKLGGAETPENYSNHAMTGKELPRLRIACDGGVAHINDGVLDIGVPQAILHEGNISPGVEEMYRDRMTQGMKSLLGFRGSFHETTKVVNSLRISTAGITMKA